MKRNIKMTSNKFIDHESKVNYSLVRTQPKKLIMSILKLLKASFLTMLAIKK